jgi:CubicO group peptidase (beta-lactamase class C family)
MKTKKKVTSLAAESPLPALMKKLKISPARVSGHVMRPAHIQGVFSDNGPEARNRRKLAPSTRRKGSKHLDVENFASGLHAALKNNTIGYCMRLQKDGKTIYTLQWNWAQTPDDDSVSWNPSRRMHVASVSKLITAIAMTKLLDKKRISYDAKIIDYLPAYWVKGTNIKKITFRHLMTHKSGFSTANGDTDYLTMKLLVLVGVQTDRLGEEEKYENINFGLCRILIAIISGLVDKNFLASDEVWDLLTIYSYVGYVETEVFGPSGVSHATLDHPDNSALAYYFPSADDGWDSENLEAVSGGAGWHLSINDVVGVAQ